MSIPERCRAQARIMDLEGWYVCANVLELAANEIELLNRDINEFMDAAAVDALMEGPRLAGWNRSQLNRAWEARRKREYLHTEGDRK